MTLKTAIDEIETDRLLNWIATATETQNHRLGQGYQGQTYLYEKDGRRWVVKAPGGWGPVRWVRRWMLCNEYKVYAALGQLDGVPKCYGLVNGSYLILEYIDGPSIRKADIDDPAEFNDALLACIRRLHGKGVAHGDLKRKENILIVDQRHPVLIDFGVAVVCKAGWAPLNHLLYRLLKQFDYNAWIKHKYGRKVNQVREEDRCYYRRTWVEHLAGWTKRGYLKIKHCMPSSGCSQKK